MTTEELKRCLTDVLKDFALDKVFKLSIRPRIGTSGYDVVLYKQLKGQLFHTDKDYLEEVFKEFLPLCDSPRIASYKKQIEQLKQENINLQQYKIHFDMEKKKNSLLNKLIG